MSIFSTCVERSINKWFEWSESCSVKIDFSIVFTGWQSEVINPWMSDISTFLSIQNRGELNDLIDWTVMSHFNDGLELLDNTSLWSEDIIFHVCLWEEISFVIQMVDDSDFLTTFCTVFNGVIKDCSIEPSWVIDINFLVFLLIIDFFGKEIGLVQFWLIDDNFFWIVSDLDTWLWKVVISSFRIIRVSNIEIKVIPVVFKDQDRNLILSEHH